MRILRASDYLSMPWKNGGGVTTEIVVSPVGAGLDDFDWRISMARVEAGGPFSSFDGIDRTLSILEGQGIVLDVAGNSPVELTLASEPYSFPADAPTAANLIGGAVTDLNVMTRRSAARHRVDRLSLSSPAEIALKSDKMLVFCHTGGVEIGGETPIRLGALDTLIVDRGASAIRLDPDPVATLFLIHIDAAARDR